MTFALRRYALSVSAACALLAGCGGAGTTASTPQEIMHNVAARTTTSSGDLLYVDDGGVDGCCAYFLVYTYPQGKLVATIGGFDNLRGECSDADGDVFFVSPNGVSTTDGTTIYEYAHGSSTPLATLSESGEGDGCAVDRTTGNLAVANGQDTTNPYNDEWGSVAIFSQATGTPTVYYSSTAQTFFYCSYDDKSNLYISAHVWYGNWVVDSLNAGSGTIDNVRLAKKLHASSYFNPSVQWDGKEMTVSSTLKDIYTGEETGPVKVYRLSIASDKATIIGTTTLKAPQDRQRGQSWIKGRTITGIVYWHGRPKISLWPFPRGGNPSRQIEYKQYPPGSIMEGVTISVAPSTSRIYK